VADRRRVHADAEVGALDGGGRVEADRRLAAHVLADLVERDVEHHRLAVVLDGQHAGDLELAFADGLDAGALEGGDRERGGVEEVAAAQVLVELGGVAVHAGQRQRHFDAGGGDVVGVIDDGPFGLAEVRGGVGEAEVAPLRDHVGVAGVDRVADRVGESGGAGGGQGGGEDELVEHGKYSGKG